MSFQRARGHADAPRDGRDRQRPVDMRFHQPDGAGQPRVVAVEAAERDQRLRVGRGARLIVDEDARHIERHRHAEPRADQMQHQVEGRRGAAGGEDRPVDDIAVGADVGARKGGGEILQILPVGRRGAAFQQAGARRAARCRPRCRRRRAPLVRPGGSLQRGPPSRSACRSRRWRSAHRSSASRRSARNGDRQAGGGDGRLAVDRDELPVEHGRAGDAVRGAQRIDRRGDAHDRRAGKHQQRQPERGSSERKMTWLRFSSSDFVKCEAWPRKAGDVAGTIHGRPNCPPAHASASTAGAGVGRGSPGARDCHAAGHEPRGLHHLRRHRLGRDAGPQPACAAFAEADRRFGDRRGQGGRGHRALPCARSRDRQAAPRRRASTAR